LVSSDITRVPVRLAQEDGSTIELDVTSIDIVVERSNSQIAVPFRDGQRFGIDLNMPQISVALTGVLVDDEGTNVPAEGAKAEFDFGTCGTFNPPSGSGIQGSFGNGRVGNLIGGGGSTGVNQWLPTIWNPSNSMAAVKAPSDLDKRYFNIPVDYLTSNTGSLGKPSNPIVGMAAHWKANALGLSEGAKVSSWTDSSGNGHNLVQSDSNKQPTITHSVYNGQSAIVFDPDDDTRLALVTNPDSLNTNEYTIFVVAGPGVMSGRDGSILKNGTAYDLRSTSYSTILGATPPNNSYEFKTTESGGSSLANRVNGTDQYTGSGGSSVPDIITAKVSGSSGSQIMRLRVDGGQGGDMSDGSHTLTLGSRGTWSVGYDGGTDDFGGYIAEIIVYGSALSDADMEKVEAYLSGKYNITLPPSHTYYRANVAYSSGSSATSINIVLDAERSGTIKEPHYYLNHQRVTDLIVSGYDPSTKIVSFSSGDPRDWFEPNEAIRVAKDATSDLFGEVITITSSSITVNELNSSTRPSSGALYIAPWRSPWHMKHRPDVAPTISIPVKDLFNPPQTHVDGTERDLAGANHPAGLFAARVAKALQSTDSLGSVALIEAGGTSASDVFNVKLLPNAQNEATRLEVEQKRKIDLPSTVGPIVHNLTIGGSSPSISQTNAQGGNFIKSAGDKAQDLIGVLNNSQNFFKGNRNNAPSWLTTLERIYGNIYNAGQARDYISGIQIPYMSTVNRQYVTAVSIYAVAQRSGSDTAISVVGGHGLIVGDSIDILTETSGFGPITTSLLGTHAVKSVTNANTFTIDLDSSANVRSAGSITLPTIPLITYQVMTFNVPYVQRNFFLTTGTVHTLDKTSVRNTTPAKTAFDINQDGHRKSGIQIAVDEFNVNFNAEDRLYEFDMTMLAVDYLL